MKVILTQKGILDTVSGEPVENQVDVMHILENIQKEDYCNNCAVRTSTPELGKVYEFETK